MPSRFNIVLVVAANAALAGFVPAQQPDTVRVAPIVITATRVPVGRDESPATVDVITRVQADGTCWVGGATWFGEQVMRISISNWATTDEDIDRSADAILGCYRMALQRRR